jgi:hypothetical protein
MVNTGKQMLRRAIAMIINLVSEQNEESDEEEDEVCTEVVKKCHTRKV